MELRVTRLADFDRICCESWPLDVFLSQETKIGMEAKSMISDVFVC
tara:strand:- start:277 stop:414 length:138 start_codon:yes stop_codon:yes gene_type:complete